MKTSPLFQTTGDSVAKTFLAIVTTIIMISAASFVLLNSTANAAITMNVNSVLDTSDASPGDGFCDDGSGNCTLRAALEESNNLAGTDTIHFAIAPFDGSVKTITLNSDLPFITDRVDIDGYTQDNATANTTVSPNPFDANILVEIDGTNAFDGFEFLGAASGSAGSTIKGLVINRFPGSAIVIDAHDIKVQGNYIGTNSTGLSASSNQVGVNTQGSGSRDDGRDALVGGLLPAERNIISGNSLGPTPSGSYPTNGWVFQGNYVGVGADGVTAIANSSVNGSGGISIDFCQDVVIGGSAVGAANVISGNLSHGLAPDVVDNILIEGNFIGTDYSGTVALGNGAAGIAARQITGVIINNIISANNGDGIYFNNVDDSFIQGNSIGTGSTGTEVLGNFRHGININLGSSSNLIGGSGVNDGNVIAHNLFTGIIFSDNNDGTNLNTIIRNSIFANTQIGIDLNPSYGVTANDVGDADNGANGLLNFPGYIDIQESSGNSTIYYKLDVPAGDYRIEFFSNTAADSSGNGEGETYLGFVNIAHSGNGKQDFSHILTGVTGITNLSMTTTQILTASATGFGSTSEFGALDIPVNDLYVTKTIVNPGSVARDTDIVYRFTITNKGPDSVDLADFPGTSPGSNFLALDIFPPDLSYVGELDPDVQCIALCPAPASVFGPTALGAHSDYGLVNFGFTGSSYILEDGESFSFDATFHVNPTSDLTFTNYVVMGFTTTDPDIFGFGQAFSSGLDIIDQLVGQNENLALAQFPIPVTPTSSTTTTTIVAAPTASGVLSTTGASGAYLQMILGFGILSCGLCLSIFVRSRRNKIYYSPSS